MFKFFKTIGSGVKRTAKKMLGIVFPKKISSESIKEIENALYKADFGLFITAEIVDQVKKELSERNELCSENVVSIASKIISKSLEGSEGSLLFDGIGPHVICLIGTNGSGKTTTAAKLAYFYSNIEKNVILGSCDTFRAAADEQLSEWADKLSVDIVTSQHGGDAAAVAFDSYKAAVARNKDLLILDTAGRLHTKSNLMGELQKILRVLKKANSCVAVNVWLVVDSTIGSNAISSAEMFNENIKINGIIFTKLDGTSCGGSLVGIYSKLRVPIYFVSSGESPDSLESFSISKYVDRLFKK